MFESAPRAVVNVFGSRDSLGSERYRASKGGAKCRKKEVSINALIRAVTVQRRRARNIAAHIAALHRQKLSAVVGTRAAARV
jgi:hypothetical protein